MDFLSHTSAESVTSALLQKKKKQARFARSVITPTPTVAAKAIMRNIYQVTTKTAKAFVVASSEEAAKDTYRCLTTEGDNLIEKGEIAAVPLTSSEELAYTTEHGTLVKAPVSTWLSLIPEENFIFSSCPKGKN